MSQDKNIKVVSNGRSLPARHDQPLPLRATPVADIYETNASFVVVLDLPGARKESIEVLVQPGRLVVRGAVGERPAEAGRMLHREIGWNRYEREFKLGPGIDQSQISAEFTDGVLTVTLPKTEDARARQIRIT